MSQSIGFGRRANLGRDILSVFGLIEVQATSVLDSPRESLDRGAREVEISQRQLWLRYFELGGTKSALEVQRIAGGAPSLGEEARSHEGTLSGAHLSEAPAAIDRDDGPVS